MALTERSRNAIYQGLNTVIHDEQAISEMLSYFPARDVEESVTKDYLRAELHLEIGVLRAEMQTEFAAVRSEMQTEFAAVRAEMQTEFAAVRSEMQTEFAAVRAEIADLRVELQQAMNRQTRWMIATIVAMFTIMTALGRLG